MTEAEKAADEYAEKLWNTGNPRDWAWSDTRKDFLAGFLAGVAWQRGRDVEAVQACAKRLEDGGSIGTAQGAFIAAGAILRESATALQKTEETTCACGHEKRQHIYEEGACRPGFVCEKGCDKYEVKKADGESRE